MNEWRILWIIGLILSLCLWGGLGIGTIISSYLQEKRSRKRFVYEQKLNTYAGHLESLANVISKETHENKQKVVYWTTRLKLIAPKDIGQTAMKMFSEQAIGQNFTNLREQLVEKMSHDLKKTL